MADTITVLASNGVKAALEELAPAFERGSGASLELRFDLTAGLVRRIEAGEAFDLAVLADAAVDRLAGRGRVDRASRVSVARSGVGIGIRKGAPRADIATPDALKRALLEAESICWAKEGASGVYFADLLERMGIAEAVTPRATLAASGAEVGRLVASGRIRYGALFVNELLASSGVEVLGPLPPELQRFTAFDAVVAGAPRNAAGAKALIAFLTTPAARAVFRAKGQDPG